MRDPKRKYKMRDPRENTKLQTQDKIHNERPKRKFKDKHVKMKRVLFKLQKITQQLFLKQLVVFVQCEKLSTMKFVYGFFKSLWFRKQLSSFIVLLIFSWPTYSPSHCFRIGTLL